MPTTATARRSNKTAAAKSPLAVVTEADVALAETVAPAADTGPTLAEMMENVRRMALKIVRKVPRGSVQLEDLYSAGIVALVECCGRFDKARATDIWTFAQYRVHGAMLDELRSLDTVSRERRRRIKTGTESPDARPAPRLVDLDDATYVADEREDVEGSVGRRHILGKLRDAEKELPERLRLVLHLRLEADWSLREIADHLGVTQGRACQLVGKGVERLREAMDVYDEDFADAA